MFVRWPKIYGFEKVIKSALIWQEREGPVPPKVVYRGKNKLDGTNAAYRVHNGVLEAFQSRERDVTPGDDNYGWARWASQQDFPLPTHPDYAYCAVFGEWAGPGVQSGMAVCAIPEKAFFVFALMWVSEDGEKQEIVADPEELSKLLPSLNIIPWMTPEIHVDLNERASRSDMSDLAEEEVSRVCNSDSYIKEVFGVEGRGEGIVYFPVSCSNPSLLLGLEGWARYAFKAKGEKVRVQKSKKAAPIDVAKAASVDEFVQMFVTAPRCEQALHTACGGEADKRRTKDFLKWINADIQSESRMELSESGLTWKEVSKAVGAEARRWFFAKCKEI